MDDSNGDGRGRIRPHDLPRRTSVSAPPLHAEGSGTPLAPAKRSGAQLGMQMCRVPRAAEE